MRESPVVLRGASLHLEELVEVARARRPVTLGAQARAEMSRSRAWVESVVRGELVDARGESRAIYGVNTGYGSLARVRIPAESLNTLSRNLLRSHAAGVGEPAAEDVARATVLLRANALARGVSGCRPELVELLLELLNRGVTPVLPTQGSCGSSGDLAPLSHLGLLIAHAPTDPEAETGEAFFEGERLSGREALRRAGLAPLALGPKEGLALTNGAQLTTAITALAIYDAERLLAAAELAAAMSIEALRGARSCPSCTPSGLTRAPRPRRRTSWPCSTARRSWTPSRARCRTPTLYAAPRRSSARRVTQRGLCGARSRSS
jgi:histidine ammonia-lyase